MKETNILAIDLGGDKRESHISPAFGKRSAYAGNFAFPK